MLERLEITNFVLIRSLVLDFSSPFAVLTGETGSGKSIILGALGLVLGEKGRADVVRQGEKEAIINALFSYRAGSAVEDWLRKRGLEGDDHGLVIQRVIRSAGRSMMSINGYSVTRSDLEDLGQLLVDVSSQHAHQSLLKKSVQLSLVDKAAHDEELLSEYRKAFDELAGAKEETERLVAENGRLSQERDYISFCLDEMEKASLRPGEDDELSEDLKRISQSGLITGCLDESVSALRGGMDSGALGLIARAQSSLDKAIKADSSLQSLADRLESTSIEIEDIAMSLGDYLSSMSFSEGELEEKSARLAQLQRLKKKYGGSLEAVIARRDEYRGILENVDNFDHLLKENAKRVAQAQARLDDLGAKLTQVRRRTASRLEKTITGNLQKLGLKSAVFTIELSPVEAGPRGLDEVVFTLCANKGEKAGPVSQVASGGELSRIMLAVKCALEAEDEVDTLLFDEIDAGLGGVVANSVACELKNLSRTHQVITISHLAQIAARAESHFLVSKSEEEGRTVSTIVEIGGEERVREIARLMAGDVSNISLEHARSLLEGRA